MQPVGPSSRFRQPACALAGKTSTEVPRYACRANDRGLVDHAREMFGEAEFDRAYREIKKKSSARVRPGEQKAFCVHLVIDKDITETGGEEGSGPRKIPCYIEERKFSGMFLHDKHRKKIEEYKFIDPGSGASGGNPKEIHATVVISGSSGRT